MEAGQPRHQIQGMADQLPGDENEGETQQKEDQVGGGLGDGSRNCGGRTRGHGGHSVLHGLVHGVDQGFIKAHLPQSVQYPVQRHVVGGQGSGALLRPLLLDGGVELFLDGRGEFGL